ncbi:WD40/YVTN/BNR-like repeat-containing protein [Thermochromatium tepidum]|uniref:Sialidase domain-containing protein n=1 Tax=Thermochromatium tepidum ATCC 43061 TaxID=316276 RepID=A0A6I6EHS4_THETI|nr:sialidase family protein [Thermochromatium tepidum]QGU33810.1 hypothetical protein E6P07_12990 [Thermochromatium tepidum ATCC 43061]
MAATSGWEYALDASGQRWLAYYDRDRLLRLREPEGQERLLVPDDRAQAPSGLALSATDKGPLVLWRDKHPKKGLYLLDTEHLSPDATSIKPLEIGGDTEALARFVVQSDAKGLTHLLWYGEKANQPTGSIHNLYYRNLDRSKQELSPIELVMAGIYPVMASDPQGNLIVFSWQGDVEGRRIVSRFRPAGGEFADTVTVADDVSEVTPIFESFRSGSRWFVIWLSQRGLDKRDFHLEGAHSDDNGKTWRRFDFEDLRGYDIASLNIAADDEGHILLAVSGRNRSEHDQDKQDVYVIHSSDRGETWSKVVRPRTGDQELLSLFHARNPSVAFGRKPGQVLLVWEDWRNIRSGLYASLSIDYGATWTIADVPLPREPGVNLGLRYEPNAVYAAGDGFRVIAERYTDDRLEGKQLVELAVDESSLKSLAESARTERERLAKTSEADLRKRVEGYWKAMQAEDYKTTYSYLDPFFRAANPLDIYLSKMGKIKYSEVKIDAITIEGPIAEVVTTIRAHVPEFKAPKTGEVIKQPERVVPVKNRWLWIDGEWVSEFRIESQDIVFTRY